MKIVAVKVRRPAGFVRRWQPWAQPGMLRRPRRLDGTWHIGVTFDYTPYLSLPPEQRITIHLGWWEVWIKRQDLKAKVSPSA